jgi:hypothetical protein
MGEIRQIDYDQQEYARSVSTLHRLGAAAVVGMLSEHSPELQLSYDDFRTSTEEMLKTDPEFRQSLDIDSKRIFNAVNGQVVAADGTPMVKLIERGMQNAFKAAQADPRMWAQYARDRGDRDNARKVDALQPGQSLVALSMDPKYELAADRKFWESRGYREGIAYVQWYSKQLDGTVVAGSVSVDMSDETTWRQLLLRHGGDVPDGITPNEWLVQSLQRTATSQQTETFVKQLRSEYYQLCGAGQRRLSLTEYVQSQVAILHQQFDLYYPALGHAIYTGQSNAALRGFAHSMLVKAPDLDPAKRQQLLHIASSERFSEADGRLLDSALLYALVEDLRRGLSGFIKGDTPAVIWAPNLGIPLELQYQMMNDRLASNVQSGASAGRTYGGCSPQFSANAEASEKADSDKSNPQTAYGGRDSASSSAESGTEVCVYEHENCYCCGYNGDGTARMTRLKVKAIRNRQGVASCLRSGCGAWLPPKGQGSKGNIWRRAQELQKTIALEETNT